MANREREDAAARLKVLVIATQKTPVAARISMALADVGFRVAALTPIGHPVRVSRKIQDHFAYHTRPRFKSTVRAIGRWSPDLLVCADDLAVRELQTLHRRTDDKARRHISELIELSLGPATSFPAIRNKSDFLAAVESEGLRSPKTIVIRATCAFQRVPAELIYPIVVKADLSFGGRCVRIVNSAAHIRATVWELQTPSTWRYSFRRFFGTILSSKPLASVRLPLRRTISLQQYIAGRPGNRAVICWKGKVLAGISVEALEVENENGPASVVRLIDHPEMAMIAERMVKRLNLSGFVGFDFVLDSSNQAWIIEMNPRVTPICHFFLTDGTNFAASLYMQMTRIPSLSILAPINCGLIALFPNEIVRSPFSEHLQFCQHDVPWNEPEVVRVVLDQALRTGILKRVRRFLGSYFPPIMSTLISLRLADPRRDN